MRRKLGAVVCAVAACVGLGRPARGSVVFNDTMAEPSGSTIDTASVTPSGNTTGYQVAASKSATSSSISNGDLHLTLNSTTTSGFVEMQALFSSDPSSFALTNIGDTVEYDVVFKNTNGGLLLASGSNIMFGLFNSGGSAPYASGALDSSGLNATAGSSFATGGTADWVGYVGQLFSSGQNNDSLVRPAQNGSGTTSANQDLLGNNFGGGAFNNPTASVKTNTASSISLTANGTYTADMLITLLAGGNVSVTESLYSGAGTGGTNMGGGTIASTPAVATSFDGLGFGIRTTNNAAALTADISDISVTYTPVPEPATLGLIGLGTFGLLHRRRRRT